MTSSFTKRQKNPEGKGKIGPNDDEVPMIPQQRREGADDYFTTSVPSQKSLRTDIEPIRNRSKISSITFTKYKKMCKRMFQRLFVSCICKKLNKRKINYLD